MRTTDRLLPLALLLFLAAGLAAAQTVPARHHVRLPIREARRQQRRVPHADQRPRGAAPAQRHVRDVGLRRQGELRRSLPRRRLRPGRGPRGGAPPRGGPRRASTICASPTAAPRSSARSPEFANPLFPAVIPGQHTINRVRNLFDAEIELFPGRWITPIVGYTRNTYTGPGRTTYTIGQDEFRLASDLDDIDQEVRAGVAFDVGAVTGRIVQGWRQFRETDRLDARSRREEREQRRPRARRPASPDRL